MYKLTSKYRGTCTKCNNPIALGSTIYYSRESGAIHETCYEAKTPVVYVPPAIDNIKTVVASAPDVVMPQIVYNIPRLTTQECYCKLVKRKCGVCRAQELAVKAVTNEGKV